MEDYRQIVKFLSALDKKIEKKTKLYLIGGSTITLTLDRKNRTEDIDVVDVEKKITDLAGKDSELAKKFNVYIHKMYEIDFSAPKDWRDIAKPIDGLSLNNLDLRAADVHDVVLGKFARLHPKDFEDITALNKNGHINIDFLLKRLNQNTKELMNLEYKNNVKLAFELIFGNKIIFRQGQALLSKK
ncbi:hypothetical protein LCGC14_2844580 [marine sediment metagenome]|uniref:DUF6036 domain-containing protein n=1 Tax=marine sediment metagenome TaxID=412755 RepID=A0A0F8YAA4_9ZZZZ